VDGPRPRARRAHRPLFLFPWRRQRTAAARDIETKAESEGRSEQAVWREAAQAGGEVKKES
jgi:hypothetical protein